ncbi:MAG TPA: hypothetical protein VM432_08705 [Bdellovibrionales bacterium]|nr:hypothetical protein [Bdellovibrionales bacterium]
MANAHTTGAVPAPGTYTASKGMKTTYSVLMFLGVLGFGLALFKDAHRAWFSFLTSYFYFISLALGGLFFAAIQNVTKAGWSVNVRRLMEAMSAYLPIGAVATVVLLIGSRYLYIWLDPETVAGDRLLTAKSAYLNMPFFIVRVVIFVGAWLILRRLIVGHSLQQDQDGQESHTLKNVGLSIAFILIFALSYSLFSVDTLMSLQPHWYSTIWGVYCFAGLFQSSLAVMVLLALHLQKQGIVRGRITEEHVHDLAKFMKAFTVFYAYIGFSQFLLIWYANLPEETIFYLARSGGGWMAATLSLLVFKFAVPFLLLLPRAAKRNPAHLTLVAILILVMQYIDIHWMVYPNFSETWILGWQEIGTFLLFGGLFLWSVTTFLSRNPVVPLKDPRLDESMHHHVTY